VLAVRTPLRAAIESLSLTSGTTTVVPRLYVGVVPSNITVIPPYSYIYRGGETPLTGNGELYEATVYLNHYARSSSELQIMENASAFLDDYNPPPFGNATHIYYTIASKTQLSEAETREHGTALYAVRYADKRKLITP
jgi:hypothetical protein